MRLSVPALHETTSLWGYVIYHHRIFSTAQRLSQHFLAATYQIDEAHWA